MINIPRQKESVPEDIVNVNNPSDSSYLFNMYIAPQEVETNDTTDIEGRNISLCHDHGYSKMPNTPTATDESSEQPQPTKQQNTKGQNIDNNHNNSKGHNQNIQQTDEITKGDNNQLPTITIKQRNLVNTKVASVETALESEPDKESTTHISDVIQDLWKQEAAKNLAYVPVKKLTAGDIYAPGSKRIKWDELILTPA